MRLPDVDNYEENSIYKREYLNKENKDFQDGLDFAVDRLEQEFNQMIESVEDDEDNLIEIFNTIEKQILEVAKENMMERMKEFADESVISAIDNQEEEENEVAYKKEEQRFIKENEDGEH